MAFAGKKRIFKQARNAGHCFCLINEFLTWVARLALSIICGGTPTEKRNMKTLLPFCISLLVAFTLQGQPLTKAIERHLTEFVKTTHFEGTALVAKNGKVVYQKGFGMANHEWGVPNTIATKFSLASISKQFTAAIILQLHEEGRVGLHTPIGKYLPSYRKDIGAQVTIHHLLTHQSGIPNYTSIPFVWEDSLRNHYSTTQLIDKFCSGDLTFTPGTEFSYNNSGYVLLAAIATAVTDSSYAELIEHRIARPLGLSTLQDNNELAIVPKRAMGYVGHGTFLKQAHYTHMANLVGAGSLMSDVGDLFIWQKALNNGRVLQPSSLKLMHSSYAAGNDWIPPFENTYGYGVGLAEIVMKYKKATMIFHSGHISGFSGFMAYLKEMDYFVAILGNKGSIPTPDMNETTLKIFSTLAKSDRLNGK